MTAELEKHLREIINHPSRTEFENEELKARIQQLEAEKAKIKEKKGDKTEKKPREILNTTSSNNAQPQNLEMPAAKPSSRKLGKVAIFATLAALIGGAYYLIPKNSKENTASTQTTKPEVLEQKIKGWTEEIPFDFDTTTYQTFKKDVPISASKNGKQCIFSVEGYQGQLYATIREDKTYNKLSQIFIAVSPHKNAHPSRQVGAKLISSHNDKYLFALESLGSNKGRVEDKIVYQELETDSGTLQLAVEVDSWGNTSSRLMGGTSGEFYMQIKMSGKASVSLITR